MNWVQLLSSAVRYIEEHLTDELRIDEIASRFYVSGSHFQLVFHLVMGMTVGEYIRNRRLSSAAQDLLQPGSKINEVARLYRYETQESFSKAFTRFHGVPPSKARQSNIRFFHPMSIEINVKGGFEMTRQFVDEFYWNEPGGQEPGGPESSGQEPGSLQPESLTPAEKYRGFVNWAARARRQNPDVFDALTEWLLDDSEWVDDRLAENEQILMQGVLARFSQQNAQLRERLTELVPSGIVNDVVFAALDRFDDELSGQTHDERLRPIVARMFADFSLMRERAVRQQIAGGKTGSFCTETVELYGYINYLKDCDAAVQWALFMPDMVEQQQRGFRLDSFEYKKLPALRFIGLESYMDKPDDPEARRNLFATLDAMSGYQSEIAADIFLVHHYGLGVDVGPVHGFWGRFMQADAPVPEGLVHFDFMPERGGGAEAGADASPGEGADGFEAGPPYLSQFAYAVFAGDTDAIHAAQGYDVDPMYDITRNTMLGQGVGIPYPDKYWTAEVFIDGYEQPSTAFMFSAEL